MMNNEPVPFEINVIGDTTGDKWFGIFKAKKRLSYRDQLRRDQIRRDLLGANAESASPLARSQAEIFAECAVRIVEAPDWWKSSGNGLDLSDDNVIIAVYESATKVEKDAFEELQKKAEAAKAELAQDHDKKKA